jgi:quercetin dioxygenase-like cupin family protein
LSGRYLRARLRTIESGGYGPLRSHRDLPVILYVVRGKLTVCTSDGVCSDLAEGDATAEGKEVTHWAANNTRCK